MALPPDASGPGAPQRRLTIEADLDLLVDGHAVAVRNDGDRLRIEVDEAQTAWRLFQSNRPGRHFVRSITDTLDALGVDVDVVVGGRHVATVGASAEAGRLLDALGLPAVEVSNPLDALSDRQQKWLLAGLAFAGGLALGARRR